MAARFRRFSGYILVVAIGVLVTAGTVSAQTSPSTPPAPAPAATMTILTANTRSTFTAVFARTGKSVEAMMLLEKASADHASDMVVKEGLAFSVME